MDPNAKNRLIKKYTTLGILLLTIALPITLFQVRQNQDSRSSAAAADKLEAEGGVLSAEEVSIQNEAQASGGQFIKFGQNVSLCLAANPNDDIPDDNALQTCLNLGGIIKLSTGNPGYIIASGVIMNKDNTVLTSDRSNKARIIAHPDLVNPLIKTTGVVLKGFSLQNIIFDGNRMKRTQIYNCTSHVGVSMVINGTNYLVDNIEVINGLCDMAYNSTRSINFEIKNSLFADNGFADTENHPLATGPMPHRFSDGLTIGNCNNGTIHDNTFKNNTDVNLIIGGGDSCKVINNTIEQTTRFGHGGLWINNFNCPNCGNGDHANSVYSNNTITANSPGSLGAGLALGEHVTNPSLLVKNARVEFNTISGAGSNLLIDGVDNVWVDNNTMSNPVGKAGGTSFGNGCKPDENYNYTAAHFNNSHLQSGYVLKSFDNFGCHTLAPTPIP